MGVLAASYGLEILIVLLALLVLLYKFSVRNLDYWKTRGIPFVGKPLPFFGNFYEVAVFHTTFGDLLGKFYNQFKSEPYFGMYIYNKPTLVVKSPEMIKAVLVKDFNYFQDRNIVSDEKLDSISANMLFLVKNPEWKALRTKLSPVFTTGKIKTMFELINVAADEMNKYINRNMGKSSLEAKDLCAKYSTDVIATSAFGINAHCFENENAAFRTIGRKMFEFHWKTSVRQTSYFLAPELVKLFRMPFLDESVTTFMRDVFWATIKEREKTAHKRNDVIDALIKIKNQASVEANSTFEGDKVVAQAGQFYLAGFETVSATMSFTLYELCLQPKIQNRLRTEIRSVLAQHNGITYDALQEMKYLHMVVCETLRKYPVLPFLDRITLQDYTLPGTDFVVKKGTPVFIPMFGLHYDADYFPEPDKYDPERFNDENKQKIPSCIYIPFGEGPRNCIGERFGLLGTKLGLARLLAEYEVEKMSATPVPLVFETKSFFLASNVGLPMKFRRPVSDAA